MLLVEPCADSGADLSFDPFPAGGCGGTEGATDSELVEVGEGHTVGGGGHPVDVGGCHVGGRPSGTGGDGEGVRGPAPHDRGDDVVGRQVIGWGVLVVLGLVGDDDQVVLRPPAGEPDVELGAAAGDCDGTEGGVHGERLDAGLGGGVAEVDVAGGVGGGEGDRGVRVVEPVRGERPVSACSGDHPAGTVADPLTVGGDELTVVAAGRHGVTDADRVVSGSLHDLSGLPRGGGGRRSRC